MNTDDLKEALREATDELTDHLADERARVIEAISAEIADSGANVADLFGMYLDGRITKGELAHLTHQRAIVQRGRTFEALAATHERGEALAWKVTKALVFGTLSAL